MITRTFGIVLPSWIYNQERRRLADEAFRTLARIKTSEFKKKPRLLVLTRDQWPLDLSGVTNFDVYIRDGGQAKGTEQTLAFGTQLLCDEGLDYITWLGDDAAFHPDCLYELNDLIARHPDAYAYSVYRSAHVTYHRPTGVEEEFDIETVCLCGHGLTFSSEEWKEWGIKWYEAQSWPSPAGDTLDLHHSWKRQLPERAGKRWCTKKSYIQHTGNEPEYAVDFQGTGE